MTAIVPRIQAPLYRPATGSGGRFRSKEQKQMTQDELDQICSRADVLGELIEDHTFQVKEMAEALGNIAEALSRLADVAEKAQL
jgi:hypothetical protein